ncbi:(2Fe-2S)-binding protein [Thermocrinis sp.]
MDRRSFIKTCSTIAVASMVDASLFSELLSAQEGMFKAYRKALLIKEDGSPLSEADLKPHTAYIFFYPHVGTPCYIINLGEEVKPLELTLKDGKKYRWQGGVGSKKSIVAYSAICAHQWSYPTKKYSFINYYPPDKPSEISKKGGIIQCCAHLALYDPKEGAKVVDGPADFPLASVVIQEEGGRFYAVGILGVDQFDKFFETYRRELREAYGTTAKARELVDSCKVVEVSKYVGQVIYC